MHQYMLWSCHILFTDCLIQGVYVIVLFFVHIQTTNYVWKHNLGYLRLIITIIVQVNAVLYVATLIKVLQSKYNHRAAEKLSARTTVK